MTSNILEGLRPLVVPIDGLVPDPRNARLHDETNLQSIRRSLERFGQHRPIVVQKEGSIIRAGNGVFTVAKELGWTEIAAVFVDESNEEAIARAIADNRTGELAAWDLKVISDELAALLAIDDELLLATGFNHVDLETMLTSPAWPKEGAEKPEGYREEDDTFRIKVDDVRPADKEAIVARLNKALKGTDYHAIAY